VVCKAAGVTRPKKQVQVWQKAYDHMNISVKVGTAFSEGTEIFTFRGNNAETEQADAFMKEVKQRFPLGNFYGEVAMVEECFEKYGRETA